MQIRDRITELVRVRASELRPHPRNWRQHPPRQRDALRGVLAEIGYADALLARRLEDGGLQLIDGHLRAETTPDALVPVLVLDVTAAEAEKLLATIDPLAALATTDESALRELLASVTTESPALQSLFDDLAGGPPALEADPAEVPLGETFQIVVECRDEDQQRELYERLTSEGHNCRLLTM